MHENFLVTELEGVVTMQIGDFIAEIELVLRSPYAVFPAVAEAAAVAAESASDVKAHETANTRYSRIYAVSIRVGASRKPVNVAVHRIPGVRRGACPEVVHPG